VLCAKKTRDVIEDKRRGESEREGERARERESERARKRKSEKGERERSRLDSTRMTSDHKLQAFTEGASKVSSERIFIELVTADREIKASSEGPE